MRKLFAFALFAALSFSLVACEEPTPEPQGPQYDITLTSAAELSFEAEGGDGLIKYQITNPDAALKVGVTRDVAWITNLAMGDGEISFKVSANELTEPREGVVTISYGEKSLEVKVMQAAYVMPDPVLTLTSAAEVSFKCAGGSGEITYTLQYPVENVEVEVVANVAWITATAGQTIAFEVAANSVEEPREGIITVSYGEQSFEVTVKQEAYVASSYDFEFNMAYLNGEYYGAISASYNYYIMLSEKGLKGDSDRSCTHFRFDLYSPKSSSYSAPSVPVGVYELDAMDTYEPGTFSATISSGWLVDDSGNIEACLGFDEGVVTITENRIEAELVDGNGATHHVVYEGPLTLGYEE